MTWVALKSLTERRMRAALTALAIVLGVAMIAGSLILTDTIDRAFTNIFGSILHPDRPRGPRRRRWWTGRSPGRRRSRPTCCRASRPCPGVEAAAGSLVDFSGTGNTAKILDRDGEVISGNMPSFGFGIDPSHERFNPLTGSRGRTGRPAPARSWSTPATASGNGFARRRHRPDRRGRPGARVHRHRHRPLRRRRLAWAARPSPSSTSPPPARCSARPASTPIQVAAEPGDLRRRSWPRRIEAVLPPGAELATGEEQAAARQGGRLRGDHLHPRHPAGLRRHRPVRRRLRHLQHPLDHGRPALARARHAAHPRRIAPAGAAVGDRRGRRHRPGGLARRDSASASSSPRA